MVKKTESEKPKKEKVEYLKARRKKKECNTKHPTKADAEIVMMMAAIGVNYSGISDELSISKRTFHRWLEDYEEIERALEKGRALRRKRTHKCFFEQAFPIDQNGRPTRQGDPSLMIFYMKTKEKWKEAPKEIKLSGSGDAPIIEYAVKEAAGQKTDSD